MRIITVNTTIPGFSLIVIIIVIFIIVNKASSDFITIVMITLITGTTSLLFYSNRIVRDCALSLIFVIF